VSLGAKPSTRSFSRNLFVQRNAGRRERLDEEMAVMRELPARRMESAKREQVKVDSGSLIHVERNSYSVNSRLIGARWKRGHTWTMWRFGTGSGK
jgi:hypothetical protein